MPKKRGNDASGGGLAARVKAWTAVPGALAAPNHKHVQGGDPGNRLHIKPGSQNKRKGGIGKA